MLLWLLYLHDERESLNLYIGTDESTTTSTRPPKEQQSLWRRRQPISMKREPQTRWNEAFLLSWLEDAYKLNSNIQHQHAYGNCDSEFFDENGNTVSNVMPFTKANICVGWMGGRLVFDVQCTHDFYLLDSIRISQHRTECAIPREM